MTFDLAFTIQFDRKQLSVGENGRLYHPSSKLGPLALVGSHLAVELAALYPELTSM